MAFAISLGLHTPSGLPYLVSEHVLPPEPSQDQYQWTTVSETPESEVEEELLVTDRCVVWSRGGLVRKVFRLEVEGENIGQAVLAWFPTDEKRTNNKAGAADGDGPGVAEREGSPKISPPRPRPSGWSTRARSYNAQLRPERRGSANNRGERAQDGSSTSTSAPGRSRAMVVFLRTQAHVYFLDGTSHVVHLPFEVESILPAPHGLLIQRRLPAAVLSPPSPVLPFAPSNSLKTSQIPPSSIHEPTPRHMEPLSAAGMMLWSPIGPSAKDAGSNLPRSFSLTDPLIEMGLVVTPSKQQQSPSATRSADNTLENLSPAEELLYVSSPTELSKLQWSNTPDEPLALALTINRHTNRYALWRVTYIEPETASSVSKRRNGGASGAQSRRRSSFSHGAGTGATTPAVTGAWDNAGAPRGHTSLGPGELNANNPGRSEDERAGDAVASSLDAEFEFQGIGGPAKQSRRVSSLLARADLSTNQDRLAFSDLAMGHASQSANIHHPGGRRGDSMGGYGSRVSSGSFLGAGRRDTMPALARPQSASSSGLHVPVDELLEELNAGGDFGGFDAMGLHDAVEGLKNEVLLKEIQSIPTGASPGSTIRPKVFSMVPPRACDVSQGEGASLVICIADGLEHSLIILTLKIHEHRAGSLGTAGKKTQRYREKAGAASGGFDVKLADVLRATQVLDAVKLVDKQLSRILVLSETADGHGELSLRGPWDYLMKLEMPSKLSIFDPQHLGHLPYRATRREGSLKRIFSKGPRALLSLGHEAPGGQVDVMDEEGKRHRIQVHMQAHDTQVAKLLDVCRWVLPGTEQGGEGILTAWWNVLRWLKESPETVEAVEWTAFVVVLMTMAVDFLDTQPARQAVRPQRKRGSGFSRSSSGAKVDLESWDKMLTDEGAHGAPFPSWAMGPGWDWILDEEGELEQQVNAASRGTPRAARSLSALAPTNGALSKKSTYLLDCAALARAFLQTPSGRSASGERGYLPTARDRHTAFRQTALATVLIGLHLFREEQKLDITTADAGEAGVGRLTPLLAQIGGWLGWEAWSWKDSAYYGVEDVSVERWLFDEGVITRLNIPDQPFDPPSIYDWICKAAQRRPQAPFKTLKDIASASQNKPLTTARSSNEYWRHMTPRTPMLVDLFSHINSAGDKPAEVVEKMADIGFSKRTLETLPEGIVAPFLEAIVGCQARPPTTWGEKLLDLLGRDDLKMLLSPEQGKKELSRLHVTPTHEAVRDVHGICSGSHDTDTVGSYDGSAEADRQAITRLIFREDRRFFEASRLVQSGRTSVARCAPEPDWSESDLLEAQKELAQTVAIRTLAVPAGRGLLYFSARLPLLTEKFPITGFNLSCVMKPSNNTVSADKSAFTEEKVGWAFFHSGVAAGLSISREAKGIDTSWIVFNKPTELSNRHAGFLLALGLNGHLKSIAKWVAFKYLTPKHTMTSIGLLLGLSASYIGTMDTLVTKLLSVHVSRMLPPGAAELNLSPLTQTTGIMGIGLLYCDTQHRRMSEVMLSEIEHIDSEDSSTPIDALRDEGYRLAAGFALGFINLAKGKDLRGLHDMRLVERLLAIAVGTKKVSIVHVLDKSTAAATVAVALIFMRSHDEALARKIDVPDTLLQFDYVRPDIFLLRTVAKHLIMWDKIEASGAWIKANLPAGYRADASLRRIRRLSSESLPLFNVVAGLCFAIGLRFAGSGSIEVRNVLGAYLDQFMRLCRLGAHNYDQKLARSTVRNCQDLLALCSAGVMAGSGDLHIFRRLRALHGRTDAETPYGSHLAAHIAVGVLFLGGGSFTFGTSPLATAALLCAFYPLFPNAIMDNKSHLQAFRHFWVLAAEARCVVARDVDSHRPVAIPLSITLRSGATLNRSSPCLLPALDDVATVATASPAHWHVVLDFARNPAHRAAFARAQTMLVRQRAAHDGAASVLRSTLRALDEGSGAAGRQALDWLLRLDAFAGFDQAERALALPPESSAGALALTTESTLVDARLVLEQACLGSSKADRLRNVKVLLEWAARAGARADGGRGGSWMTAEVVDRLRARVWLACQE
ncbi:MAG: Anaphase-promoting complex subunit 1 [Thelocarpon impressellum]|nr:MAG: Anaphase-promoting complex subunit 1 [Thelocarpon impressellum]